MARTADAGIDQGAAVVDNPNLLSARGFVDM
jgi:hypothetical protein